jgi:hypothetical protein
MQVHCLPTNSPPPISIAKPSRKLEMITMMLETATNRAQTTMPIMLKIRHGTMKPGLSCKHISSNIKQLGE